MESRAEAGAGGRVEAAPVRAWTWLAALLLLAAPLSTPYQVALSAQSPYVLLHERAARTLLALSAEAVLFGWPLAYAGLWLGRALGWGAPWLAGARPWRQAARPWAAALLAGVIVGAVVSAAAIAVPRLFPGSFVSARAELPPPAPWKGIVGGLGAGVTEEVSMRLFLMTALARLFAHAVRGRDGAPPGGPPSAGVAWAANALTALAFGALHFSNVAVLGMPFSFANLSFVLLLNALLGLTCGELYRRQGIESAILAHFASAFVAHGVFPALSRVL